MYHPANIKRWFHHVHIPQHANIVRAEKLLKNKRLWAVIGITGLVLGFILLLVWAAQTASFSSGSNLNLRDLFGRYPYYP